MRFAFAFLLAAVVLADDVAFAQEISPKPAVPQSPKMVGEAASGSDKARGDAANADEVVDRLRRDIRRNAGSANPFPYTVATEPTREPYRRPVPCSTFARETDGTTTCIGIQDRTRAVARAAATATPARTVRVRRYVEQRPRMAERDIDRRPTDPRFDPPPTSFAAPMNGGNGFLAFLGRALFR